MTELINLETKQELTDYEFRATFPNTSFGPVIDYTSFGYAVVYPTPQPVHDPVIQTVRRLPAVLTDKGHYEQAYEVVDLDVETIAANQEDKRIAAIPSSVSPRQIRQALTAANLRTQVEAAVAAADQDTKDWYEFATIFERQHPMVIALASSLSVTERQLDDLFTLAGSL